MRASSLLIVVFLGLASASTSCIGDNLLVLFKRYPSLAAAYCTLFADVSGDVPPPGFEQYSPAKVSSACSCLTTGTSKTSAKSTSLGVKSSSSSLTTQCVATSTTVTSVSTVTAAPSISVVYSTIISTVTTPATSIQTEIDNVTTTLVSTEIDNYTTTLSPPTVTEYCTIISTVTTPVTIVQTEIDNVTATVVSTEIDNYTATLSASTVTEYVTVPTTVVSYSTLTSVSTTTVYPSLTSSSDIPSSNSSSVGTSSLTTTSSLPATTSPATTTTTPTSTTPSSCTATAYSQIAPLITSSTCLSITLQDIHAPSNSTIALTSLKPGTVITFAGTTTFGFTNSSTFDPITISNSVGITVQGAEGHVIDGNGQAYWDGLGSNGGVPKPNHMVAMSKITGNSIIRSLNIVNYPVHCFSISSSSNLLLTNIHLDNSAGNAPNNRSNGLPASHNSDGFDLATSNNVLLRDSTVTNQDDCVAITSGNNVTVDNMSCTGGHGMSIGSVGGKSNNNVTNIVFSNSVIALSTNGPRIKTNYNTTGFISNITYTNISLSGISTYGIDIQQDYLNGGPTGSPTNGVVISNILFSNVTGTAIQGAQDYYILCGQGSCSNFVFDGVSVVGGSVPASCNYPATGCPGP